MSTSKLVTALLLTSLLASCKNTQDSGYEDPYADFGSDGGYNPYPSGGYASTGSTGHDSLPMDDYQFDAPPSSSASKPSSSSSSTYKPTPKPAAKPTPKPAPKKPAVVASRSHTVVKGDTLYGLARRYKTTVAKIKSANGLSSDLIRIGQRLKIPS
jgi:LysM repeat protein